ncbi:MAG: PhzF family phenazine biosynthesis protein [candidate division WOR-3 bacterium]|nr:MAG: PhzF family phenazine biosynthesis protein [candidate division WOR-3 bacterium]
MKKECIFIDVFTDVPYAGNQLAVFPHADDLTGEQMQRLANEINYSETTFILKSSEPGADFDIRIFTIKRELLFAGHPTLGTAYSIMNIFDIWREKKDILRLKTGVGIIPLEGKDDSIWMTQNEPEFINQYSDKKEIASLINLLPEDISDNSPIEDVSTGANVLIIPLKNLHAIQHASGNVNNLKKFFKERKSGGPYLFSLETTRPNVQVHSRFFAPHIGIIEDPATGSAAGPLTAYLLKHNIFGESFEIANEQGIEMGRPSMIFMKGDKRGNTYTVKIGGKSAYVGRGEFEIT